MSQTLYKSLAIISALALGFSASPSFAQYSGKVKMNSGKIKPDSGKMKLNSGKMKINSGKNNMNSGKMKAMGNSSMQGGSAPAGARDPNAYSDGYNYQGIGGFEKTDMMTVSKILAEEFEYSANKGNDALVWDTQGWRGTDYNKLWVKFQGQKDISANSGELELQALYSHTVAAFWDFQVGARYDTAFGSGAPGDRVFAVIGFQGLAPYWFEVEPVIFVSNKGDISARFTASYDLLLTQRLILQPRFETNIAARKVREYDIGTGLNDIQLDLRLRYEIRRKFAPYIGVSWNRKFGDTATMVRTNGGDVSALSVVSGIRFWF